MIRNARHASLCKRILGMYVHIFKFHNCTADISQMLGFLSPKYDIEKCMSDSRYIDIATNNRYGLVI